MHQAGLVFWSGVLGVQSVFFEGLNDKSLVIDRTNFDGFEEALGALTNNLAKAGADQKKLATLSKGALELKRLVAGNPFQADRTRDAAISVAEHLQKSFPGKLYARAVQRGRTFGGGGLRFAAAALREKIAGPGTADSLDVHLLELDQQVRETISLRGLRIVGKSRQYPELVYLYARVEDLEISKDTKGYLKKANIVYLGELVKGRSKNGLLLGCLDMSPKDIETIEVYLVNLGFSFGMQIEGFHREDAEKFHPLAARLLREARTARLLVVAEQQGLVRS